MDDLYLLVPDISISLIDTDRQEERGENQPLLQLTEFKMFSQRQIKHKLSNIYFNWSSSHSPLCHFYTH